MQLHQSCHFLEFSCFYTEVLLIDESPNINKTTSRQVELSSRAIPKSLCITFNPFTTEPQAIFLLLENDNLGIIN